MEIDGRRRTFRNVALACAALMFAVTALSAYVRLANAGSGGGTETDMVLLARGAHRVAASTVLLGFIALVLLSLGPRPYLQREGKHALALLALVVFLAVLGRWSGGAVAAPIVLGNLLGGFLAFALCARLALPRDRPVTARLERWAWLAAGVVVLLAVLGALVLPAHLPLGWMLVQNVAALLLLAALLRVVRLPWLDVP